MEALTIYIASSVAKIAAENSKAAAELNRYCREADAEVVFYEDRVAVTCGVRRTYKVPSSISDMESLAKWLKGRIAATEREYEKSPFYTKMKP